MHDTLLYIVSSLVDNPDQVVIDEHKDGDTHVFSISVHPDDMGKLIGKNGRIIRAVREIGRVIAAKQNMYVDIEVVEQASQTT